MQNIFSIDLESWVHFHLSAFKKPPSSISNSEKKNMDAGYIPKAVKHVLGLLDRHRQKATFFVIGEIYEWYPETIREIMARGHEIAYHSYTHALIKNREMLRDELEKSRRFIGELKPVGFRAPYIYFKRDSMACLKEYGFKYSSSTYGDFQISNCDGIDEIPVSAAPLRAETIPDDDSPKHLTFKMLSREIPFGSGLFISLLRSRTSSFIERMNRRGKPAVLFIHLWQAYMPKEILNPSFRLKVLFRNPLCFPYTWNIQKPLDNLLSRHSFTSFKELFYS